MTTTRWWGTAVSSSPRGGCVLTVASAPGKVILFGEHAVVSGANAIGAAVDLRARASIEDAYGGLEIDVYDLCLNVSGFSVKPSGQVAAKILSKDAQLASRYLTAVVEEFQARNLKISITSDIPPGSGLGSSAAIVVATAGAVASHMGLDLSLNELASVSHKIERAAQEGLGSPMDTALATFGGYQIVSSGGVKSVDLDPIDLVVAFSGVSHDTRHEVAKVQDLKRSYPDIVDPIFDAIGSLTLRAISCLNEGKYEELGRLMNINHGLLEAIGVSTNDLCRLVYAARGVGRAWGAKLTGAGGGGCVIVLPSPGFGERLIAALEQIGGICFKLKTGISGFLLEDQKQSELKI